MTEQEIINVLKENKKKGVAYLFLPLDVKDWISDNFNNSDLVYLDSMGDWELYKDADFDDYDNIVFALPDDYKEEPKGEWVEFDIDEKGNFHCFIDNDMHYFFWANWNVFLTEADSSGYTAFGGWQYKDSKNWYQYPILLKDNGQVMLGSDDSDDVKPAIPIKIRFWREC